VTAHPDSARHYAALAASFDQHWIYSPEFVGWMAGRLREHLQVQPTDQVADVGCGTGLYSRPLADVAEHVTALDPTPEMIRGHRPHARVASLVATAEQFAARQVLPGARYDAVLLKEVLHHLDDRPRMVQDLAARLRPGGRLLIVITPPTIAHPLFAAALQRYARNPLTAEHVADWMRTAGLAVQTSIEAISVELPVDRWADMVRSRYLSLLAWFDDEQLAAGVAEIRRLHDPVVRFADRYIFVVGTRPAG
jgi:2-polyprenyl-3-methyl-5-hydroxy-6-metoxy-1,4-benzoquinol methylase